MARNLIRSFRALLAATALVVAVVLFGDDEWEKTALDIDRRVER